MAENKGRIDTTAGKKFETDHYDVVTKEFDPNERTICGHIDKSSRGDAGWMPPFGPAGAVEAKVADSTMARKSVVHCRLGPPMRSRVQRQVVSERAPRIRLASAAAGRFEGKRLDCGIDKTETSRD